MSDPIYPFVVCHSPVMKITISEAAELLGVRVDSPLEESKSAFKKLALKWYVAPSFGAVCPDRGRLPTRMGPPIGGHTSGGPRPDC